MSVLETERKKLEEEYEKNKKDIPILWKYKTPGEIHARLEKIDTMLKNLKKDGIRMKKLKLEQGLLTIKKLVVEKTPESVPLEIMLVRAMIQFSECCLLNEADKEQAKKTNYVELKAIYNVWKSTTKPQ